MIYFWEGLKSGIKICTPKANANITNGKPGIFSLKRNRKRLQKNGVCSK
jgi:hypothetical protein